MKIKVTIFGVPLNAIGMSHRFDTVVDIPENPTNEQIITAVYEKAQHVHNIDQIVEQIKKEIK